MIVEIEYCGKWPQVAYDVLLHAGADGLTEQEWRERFALRCTISPSSIRTTFGRAMHFTITRKFVTSNRDSRGVVRYGCVEILDPISRVMLRIESAEAELAQLRTTLAELLKGE